MKYIASLSLLLMCVTSFAQRVADFEDFGLNSGEFMNGDDLSGGFTDEGVFLPNEYNTMFASWTGWALSAGNDTTTPGFTNQYSAIPGEGAEGSSTYAVRYHFVPNQLHLTGESMGKPVSGMYITNSTYAFLSMRDGDAYAKRFGGESGTDPDYFLLTIKGFRDSRITSDSVNFYLADFRSDAPDEDYIIDEWTWVDLTALGAVDSLWFNLESTDNGQFGMNTPAYFCIDRITTSEEATSARNVPFETVKVYPNPATNQVNVDLHSVISNIAVFDYSGQLLFEIDGSQIDQPIDVSSLSNGVYLLHVTGVSQNYVSRFQIVR